MFVSTFHIPQFVAKSQRVSYLIDIINKYRNELPVIRKKLSVAKKKIINLEKEIKQYIEDQKKLKQKIKDFLHKVNNLEHEKRNLEKELERVTKTNKRLTTAIFEHGNLKTKVTNSSKKLKGGQKDHKDTNRESKENAKHYLKKRLSLNICPHCSHKLNRVNSTKDKALIDIVITPTVTKLLLQTERQWCSHCKREVRATHNQSLPFTEYGINTLLMVLLLRFKANLSFKKISTILEISFGLSIAPSSIYSLLAKAKRYLDNRYQELTKQVRDGQLMYNDETGWLIGKSKAWVWIMANEDITVYYPAESRGSGIFEQMYGHSQSLSMHDGLASYEAGLKDKTKHAYCWAHFLRFVHEETAVDPPKGIGIQMKEKIVNMYRLKDSIRDKEKLKQQLEQEIDDVLNYNTRKTSIKNIQTRLRNQKKGLILALLHTPDGTNNLAERELRPIVLLRKTTNGSNTFVGMEITATLASIVQTTTKQNVNFFSELQKHIHKGVTKKYKTIVYS